MTSNHTHNKQQLLLNLKEYKNNFKKEELSATEFISFIETDPNCYERSNSKGHITCSSWVLNSTCTKVLLTHHKKLNTWIQLGGHADGNSNTLEVALKELKEESGIINVTNILPNSIFDIDKHLIPQYKNVPKHFHYDIRYLFKVTNITSEQYIVSDESHDLAWIPLSEIKDYNSSKSILRMLSKHKSLLTTMSKYNEQI